jgi:hypothetical protein
VDKLVPGTTDIDRGQRVSRDLCLIARNTDGKGLLMELGPVLEGQQFKEETFVL